MINTSQIVIGTAGHIDHGKTSIVKALTGTDTDVLSEEKIRGMTIDIGFAYLNKKITIKTLDDTTHLFPLEKPNTVSELINKFLEDII